MPLLLAQPSTKGKKPTKVNKSKSMLVNSVSENSSKFLAVPNRTSCRMRKSKLAGDAHCSSDVAVPVIEPDVLVTEA